MLPIAFLVPHSIWSGMGMSKHCEVCKRSYPDELAACPYCAEVVKLSDDDMIEVTEEAPDSAVDLGLPAVASDSHAGGGAAPTGDASSLSFIEWASLVEEKSAPAEPAASHFDDPADAHLNGPASQPEAAAGEFHSIHSASSGLSGGPAGGEAPTAVPADDEDALAGDLAAVRSIFAGDASASLSRGVSPPDAAAPIADASDSALDLLAPNGEEESPPKEGASLAAEKSAGGHDPEPPMVEAMDSGIDLVAADLEEELVADAVKARPVVEAGDSGIDLADVEALGSGSDLGHIHVADSAAPKELSGIVVVDSGIDLIDSDILADLSTAEPPANELSGRPISDAGLDLSGDDLVAADDDSGHLSGIEKNTPDTSESGRDRIAEEVESSVDLPVEQFDIASGDSREPGADAVAGQLASEEEEVDLTEMSPADLVDSSSVDLGASATFPVAPPEPAPAPRVESTRPYQPRSKSIHGEEELSPSEVNLGGRHDEPSRGEDFFDEAAGLGASGVPLQMAEGEPSGLLKDEEAAVATHDGPVDEHEEIAAEEEPERPAKAKKEKRRSAAGAWSGGALLGAIVATGACLALWFFKLEPPNEWRGVTASGQGATTANIPNTQVVAPLPFAERAAAVRSGDLERAQKSNIEAADETKLDEVAARGEYRVRNYLAQQYANNKPVAANDPALQAGVKDLETAAKADDPAVAANALFYLGVTREASKDYEGALKAYKEGADRFKGDAAQKERFDAGINRVTPMTAGATGRAEPADGALLALLLTALEPTDAVKPPDAVDPAKPAAVEPGFTEAGSAFWLAVTKAREGKYDDALAAIKQASEIHTRRRFTMLGKAQNPNSDPTEEIFLRSCEELKAYWELQTKLSTSGLPLVKGKGPAAAVDAVLAENKVLTEKLAKATTDAATQKKAMDAAEKNIEDAKKETEKTKKDLEASQKDVLAAKDDVETKKNDLAASEKIAASLMEKLKTAEVTTAKETETLKRVAEALTPKFLKPEADDAALLSAVKDAARLAAIADPQDRVHTLQGEVAGLNNALKQRWQPDQMLTFWMPLLQERGRTDLADKAVLDADRVLKEAKASPEDKARAHAVKGTALRNQGKYAEAKAELEQAKANLPKEDGVWWLETEAALKEASDPSAYFAARAEKFRMEGQDAQALAMLNRALETAAPAAKSRLIVERGALHLEQALAHDKGRVAANDPDLVAARKDADEAKKGGGADALYLSGRIAEQLGQTDEAIRDYRQALKAHGALDADGARYRAALARMLVLPKTAAVGKGEGAPGLDVLVALIAVGLQPAESPGSIDPAKQEALKLADEILSAKESDVPFEARAQAYAIKGLWTPALRIYVEGLRPFLSPEHADGLLAIINGHPYLRRPSVLTVADPMEAEKHYAAGLRWYNDREYAKAEKEFSTAVEQDSLDARYYYYLGLAQLMLGDRDALEDFERGARLEQQNRPPRAAVSAALERVQGMARLRLNAVRDQPR
jgi:hypothetical protein